VSQQINLYQAQFRRERLRYTGKTLLTAFMAIIVGVAGMAAHNAWQLRALRAEVVALDARHQDAVQKREALEQQLAAHLPDTTLKDELSNAEKLLQHRRELHTVLQKDAFAKGSGYSSYFVALARQHITGLWLTGITITGAGRELRLQGKATAPELVPRYLQRLSNEPVLSGTQFELFQLNRDEEQRSAPLAFLVATHGEEKPL
jgi:Tfp pilus assembly protein PilN